MKFSAWKQKRRAAVCGILALLLLIGDPVLSVSAADDASAWPEAPDIKAPGAIVMEAETGSILYNKNAYDVFYPASTTKLMTALLAIEQAPLTDVVTCSHDAIYSIGWDSSRIGLVEGEQISMEDALYAILLASANEVCYAVAEQIGGTVSNFVSMMNQRATDLGCLNTHFTNPHGLDNPDHFTCPYDLALIARQAIQYTTFRRISGSYYHRIPETNKNVARDIGNTHLIIRKRIKYDGVFAGKTGHTSTAGNALVTCAERNGLTLICVVMKESVQEDAYNDTMALLDYAFQNFGLYDISSSAVDSDNAFPVLFEDEDAFISEVSSPLSISDTTLVLPIGASYADVEKRFSLTPLTSFVKGENVIGTVSYYYTDVYVGSAEIRYNSPEEVVPEPSAAPEQASPSANPTEAPAVTSPAGTVGNGASETSADDLRPMIIGIAVFLITFLLLIYLVFIELPYRRKRKAYRNRQRMH